MFEKSKNFVIFKILTIGFLSLLLLIPTAMIGGLINEREQRRNEAINEIDAKWGNKQTVAGPILSVPYKKMVQQEGKTVEVVEYAHFLPNTLTVKGTITPEMRQRGIYQVVVYGSDLKFSGTFSQPNFKDLNIPADKVLWNQSVVSVGIPDMRGIKDNVVMKWGGKNVSAKPGIAKDLLLGGIKPQLHEEVQFEKALTVSGVNSGINFKVPQSSSNTKKLSFSFGLKLNGS